MFAIELALSWSAKPRLNVCPDAEGEVVISGLPFEVGLNGDNACRL